MNYNIIELFLNSAERYPEREALIDKEGSALSFSELKKQVQESASRLSDQGIKHGDNLLVAFPMSVDLYVQVLALLYIGAVPVFLDNWRSFKNIRQCAKICNCQGIISSPKGILISKLAPALWFLPNKIAVTKAKNSPTIVPRATQVEKNQTALISFTSGTSGVPKAANRTHGLLNEQFKALTPMLTRADSSVDMPMLPVILLLNLGLGRTSVLPEFNPLKPADFMPNAVVRQIEKHGIESLTCSPFYLEQITDYAKRNQLNLPLKSIITGGGPLRPESLEKIRAYFSNTFIQVVYGSTEAEPIAHFEVNAFGKKQKEHAALYLGEIVKEVSVAILPLDSGLKGVVTQEEFDEAISCQEQEPGELLVSGPHVLEEYINNPLAQLDNKILVGDIIWHRTGDLIKYEEDGLYFYGRRSRIIRSNEKIVYPFLIEKSINGIPDVGSCALTCLDEKLYLCIEPRGASLKIEAIRHRVSQLLEGPCELVQMPIPKDSRHFTKIDGKALDSALRKRVKPI